jgi:hypothetical protein
MAELCETEQSWNYPSIILKKKSLDSNTGPHEYQAPSGDCSLGAPVSTEPWRRIEARRYNSTHYRPRQWLHHDPISIVLKKSVRDLNPAAVTSLPFNPCPCVAHTTLLQVVTVSCAQCTKCIQLKHNGKIVAVCPSVRPHLLSLKLLDGFRLNLIL